MNWLAHILTNLIIGGYLYNSKLITLTLLIFFITLSIFIDIDQLLYFLIKYRKNNLSQIIKIWKKHYKNNIPGFYIFHSPEFNLILLVIAFFNPLVALIFLSNIIHISLDIIQHVRKYKNLNWIKEWSIVYQITK